MKKQSVRRTLVMSVLALTLCIAMLAGSTFAWFTDSVVSGNNIIKTGTLDIDMQWADGKEDPATATWNDASTGAIFNYDLWEPGYTEVRHVKIINKGTLALQYQLQIAAEGEVSDLADVIDVYFLDSATQITGREALPAAKCIGTLSQVLDGISNNAQGVLLPGENGMPNTASVTIALKMQESAGNEYQDKAIGSSFSVKLFATQYTYEEDSFDKEYDKDAKLPVFVNNLDDMKDALVSGGDVVMTEDLSAKSGELTMTGGTLDGDGNEIAFTSGSSSKPILGTTGGTVQNITFNGTGSSVQGIGAGMTTANPLTEDLYINNVTVDGVMYAVIGTAQNVNVIVTDSTLYGAFSYPGAAKVELTDTVLGAGNSMYDFFEVTSDTTFNGCTFEDNYCFLAYGDSAGKTVTFNSCNYEGQPITADNFKSLLIDDRWDYGEPASTYMKDCIIVVDGVQVIW